MKYFDTYVSNSVAGSANQFFFSAPTPQTGRVFYKIACGGSFSYSLLFSNLIDSTFADGSKSNKNRVCDEWTLLSARVGRLKKGMIPPDFAEPEQAEAVNCAVENFLALTFGGRTEKTVAPGEFFTSDPLTLSFDAGDYLCLETCFVGDAIPYHEESILPVFRKTEEGWRYGRTTFFAGMIGCNRPVKGRVSYLGDSITQGIGVARNSYAHWNALLSERLGTEYAFWNLGIGYGRADDIASDGAWLFKARQNDVTVLCAGVNDLNRGFTAEEICRSLTRIVDTLTACGQKIVLQTVPPFNYDDLRTERWNAVNGYIRTELGPRVCAVFDTVPVLGQEDRPQNARYGGHPDAEGSAAWAEMLYPVFERVLVEHAGD